MKKTKTYIVSVKVVETYTRKFLVSGESKKEAISKVDDDLHDGGYVYEKVTDCPDGWTASVKCEGATDGDLTVADLIIETLD